MKRPHFGVRVRVTFAVTALFGIALVLGAVFLVRAVEDTVVHHVEYAQTERLETMRAQVEHGVPIDALKWPPGAPNMQFEVRKLDQTRVMPRIHIMGVTPAPALPDPEILSGRPVEGWSVTRLPSISPSEGHLMLIAASPLDDIRRSVEALRRVLWGAIPALVLAIALGAWWVTGRALSPVRAMIRRVASITESTLHERVHVSPSGDEIAELAHTMNSMLDRLERAARRQREFVSDASHELRSPVASIRTQLEVALAHPQAIAAERWPGIAHGVLAEGVRIEKLVADLLLLARLDEATAPTHAEVDLDDLILEQAMRTWRLDVRVERVQAARLTGDRQQLACAARNLIENAVRHAKTRVEVATTTGRTTTRMIVDDDGEGIPREHRRRIFERFTRLEEGRSRDAGGAGLGLAMVRRIVDLHGGTVTVTDSPLGGARFTVSLPRG